MNNSISFTIPFNQLTLRHTAQCLIDMAESLRAIAEKQSPVTPPQTTDDSKQETLDSDGTTEETQGEMTTATLDAPKPPNTGTSEVDAAGMPWDARIHASTKTKYKDKETWKLKRGVDKDLVAQVEAELKGAATAPVIPTPPKETTNVPTPPAPGQFESIPATAVLQKAVADGKIDDLQKAAQELGYVDFGAVITQPQEVVDMIHRKAYGIQ